MKSKSLIWVLAGIFLLCLCGAVIPVSAAAPVAAFSGDSLSGPAPLNVTFTDASTGSPTGWAWFFGDENYTQAWTQQTANAGWSARYYHSSVISLDGGHLLKFWGKNHESS